MERTKYYHSGERLCSYMDAMNMSQQELHRCTGLSIGMINCCCKGKTRPLVDNAIKIANALGVKPSDIWPNELYEGTRIAHPDYSHGDTLLMNLGWAKDVESDDTTLFYIKELNRDECLTAEISLVDETIEFAKWIIDEAIACDISVDDLVAFSIKMKEVFS